MQLACRFSTTYIFFTDPFICNITSPSFNTIGVSCELLGNFTRVNVTLKCTSCTSSSEYHTTVNDRPIVISNLPAGNYTVDVTAVDVNIRTVEVIIVSDEVTATITNVLNTIITTDTTTNTLSTITADIATNTPIIMATDNTPTTIVTATNDAPTTVPTDTATRTPGPTTESMH